MIITKPYEGYFYFFNYPLLPLVFKNWYLDFRGTTFIIGMANLNVKVIPYNDIKYVLFGIDGYTMDMQYGAAPQYESKIYRLYPAIGRHVVKIYAYDTSGKVASDEMNIIN